MNGVVSVGSLMSVVLLVVGSVLNVVGGWVVLVCVVCVRLSVVGDVDSMCVNGLLIGFSVFCVWN